MDNDYSFLALFIILPTALIVSGFWLFLFVRRDGAKRGNLDTSTAVDSELSNNIPLELAKEDAKASTAVTTSGPVTAAANSSDEAPSSGDHILSESDDVDDEFWTPEPIEVETGSSQAASSDEISSDLTGHTQEIVPVSSSGPDDTIEAPIEKEDSHDDQHQELGDTANLPIARGPDNDKASVEDQGPERRQRHPRARLVPSTKNIQRRMRQAGRRIPSIDTSPDRDENAVEGSDSRSDV